MAKKRKQKQRQTRVSAGVEDSRAEVITVAWMLAMMTTLGAELVGGLLRLISSLESASTSLVAFPNLMLFTSAVTGIVCLSLTPFVYRFRRMPPPTAVTVLAVTVSVLPLAIGIAQSLR